MFDLFESAVGGAIEAQIAGLTGLQANTDTRLTGTTDRLTALEHRYERMQLVLVALWALLKAHTGLSDSDLKAYMRNVEAANSGAAGKPAVIKCENCHRIIRASATRCVWCGATVNAGNAFQGT